MLDALVAVGWSTRNPRFSVLPCVSENENSPVRRSTSDVSAAWVIVRSDGVRAPSEAFSGRLSWGATSPRRKKTAWDGLAFGAGGMSTTTCWTSR